MQILKIACAALLVALSAQAAAVGSLAELSVYDRSENRQLPVYWHEGRAYVVGKPGNEYRIALRSRRGEDLLAVLSVDGVNAISGETATVQQSGYVLSPWHALEVQGWRKDLSRRSRPRHAPRPSSAPATAGSRPRTPGTPRSSAPRASPPRPSLSTTTATATCWRAG